MLMCLNEFYFRRLENSIIKIGKTASIALMFAHLKWNCVFYSKLYLFLAKSYSSLLIGFSVNITTFVGLVNSSDFVKIS